MNFICSSSSSFFPLLFKLPLQQLLRVSIFLILATLLNYWLLFFSSLLAIAVYNLFLPTQCHVPSCRQISSATIWLKWSHTNDHLFSKGLFSVCPRLLEALLFLYSWNSPLLSLSYLSKISFLFLTGYSLFCVNHSSSLFLFSQKFQKGFRMLKYLSVLFFWPLGRDCGNWCPTPFPQTNSLIHNIFFSHTVMP